MFPFDRLPPLRVMLAYAVVIMIALWVLRNPHPAADRVHHWVTWFSWAGGQLGTFLTSL